MATYENKTTATEGSVDGFLDRIVDDDRRSDCRRLRELMASASGEEAVLWGAGIVGFGAYHYRYASGREGDTMAVGFAPRSANIALYVAGGHEAHGDVLRRLGTFKTGKGCLYLRRLSDVDEDALSDLIRASVDRAAEMDTDRA